MKGNQTCIYGDPARSRTEGRPAISPQLEVPPPPPLTHWPTSPENVRRFSPPISDIGLGASAATPSQAQLGIQGEGSPNDHVTSAENVNNTSPETANPQAMSPEMSTYAATQFSLGSNDSIVPRSSGSQPTFNVAISRWFDMLVGDNPHPTFENATSNFDIGTNEHSNVETIQDPDLNGIPYMGHNYSTPSGADIVGIVAASPSSSSPQLLERSAPGPDRNAISEKLRWQAPDTIQLLPYEHFIFRNFVQRISLWVIWCRCLKKTEGSVD
jgi:hypothetical protein